MPENNLKPFWKSKTVWIGVLEIIGGIATAIAGSLEAGIPVSILGLLQIILRIITRTGLSKSNGPVAPPMSTPSGTPGA